MFEEILFTAKPKLAKRTSLSRKKLIMGVGINDANYFTVHSFNGKREKCPFYTTWLSMLTRCYNKKYHTTRPNHATCTVHPSWLRFSTFKAWMKLQDYKGNVLDKDILIKGNKEYGPNTCIFVSKTINSLFNLNEKTRGKYPIGVCLATRKKDYTYQVFCRFYGKPTRIGYFNTVEEANAAYNKVKKAYIIEIANTVTNMKLKQALINRSNDF